MRRSASYLLTAMSALAALSLSIPQSAAQTLPGDAAEKLVPASSVCLAGAVRSAQAADRPFSIAVPSEKAAEFLKRGFVQTECTELKPIESESKRDICKFADARDPGLNAFFWNRYGMTPQEICKSVSAAAQK